MNASPQQIDFLTRQLARKYPEHRMVEIETAVLLAVLEAGDVQDRERIRVIAGTLLSNGGIDAACAIAGTYGVEAISRHHHRSEPSDSRNPGDAIMLHSGFEAFA